MIQDGGGFRDANRELYDPRDAIERFTKAGSEKSQLEVFSEWWVRLYKAGSVDLASYAVIPKMVRVSIEEKIFVCDFFRLIALVEIHRHDPMNLDLPSYMEEEYHTALKWVAMIASSVPDERWTREMIKSYCAAVATSKGDRELTKRYLGI